MAEDPETGKRGPRTVTHVWVHGDDLVDFRIADDVVTTTEDHPFWNATDRQWEGPKEFDAGDRVLTADGNLLVTRGLMPDSWHTGSAYNLTVNDIHTFYVVVAGEAVLVHNTCEDVFIDDALLTKLQTQHTAGGSNVGPDQSTFNRGLDFDDLAACANQVACTSRADGWYERDVDYGSIVGTVSSTGLPTTWFRVVQDGHGVTRTIHPIPAY